MGGILFAGQPVGKPALCDADVAGYHLLNRDSSTAWFHEHLDLICNAFAENTRWG